MPTSLATITSPWAMQGATKGKPSSAGVQSCERKVLIQRAAKHLNDLDRVARVRKAHIEIRAGHGAFGGAWRGRKLAAMLADDNHPASL